MSSPKTDTMCVPLTCAHPGALPLPAVPPGSCCSCGFTPCFSDAYTEMPVVVQIPLCLSHVCLEMPRAAVEQFPQQHSELFFKSTSRAKKSLPANTAFGPGTEGRSPVVRRPNHFSWKVLCCCLFWKHRCNLFLCSAFWCHQLPGMKSRPCAYKWKISIRFSEMGS